MWLSWIASAFAFYAATAAAGGGEGYPNGLQTVPSGDDAAVKRFVSQGMEPRHAVVVAITRKGSKRHQLLERVAVEERLHNLALIGTQHAKADGPLTLYKDRYTEEIYDGKWTKSAIVSWLASASYPLVNRMQYQFAPPKYLTATAFGTVLIVKQLIEQTDELVRVLEPFAEQYSDRLKFSFFVKTPSTENLCSIFGVRSNDELLILERPREAQTTRTHSNVPPPPKYRLEGVTPETIESFFAAYAAGSWPRYFKSAEPRGIATVSNGGLQKLTGWDFETVVGDPSLSVLVEFVSADCANCDEFAEAYEEVAARVAEMQRTEGSLFAPLVVARIDQTANEHPELVRGTPWMRYWPRGKRKRSADVELRSVDSIMDYLEERLAEESEEGGQKAATSGDDVCRAGTCRADAAAGNGGRVQLTPPKPDDAQGYLSAGSGLSVGNPAPDTAQGFGQASAGSGPNVVLPPPRRREARGYMPTSADPDEFDELATGVAEAIDGIAAH